jgi:hypothetical protein
MRNIIVIKQSRALFDYINMETYGYIYLTTNKINGKIYIGQHKSNTGKHWYTNGKDNIISFICPDGFYKGRVA